MILPLLLIEHFITVIKIKINMLGGTQNATLIKNQNITNVHKNQLAISIKSQKYSGIQKYC